MYNTNHDYRSEIAGFEVSYRLPLRSKLSFEYEYEKVTRKNAPVEKTEEDRYTLGYRIQPWSNFTARLEVSYADRAADTYEWAQYYYALLDTELINATPDNQRYINHPELMKYYMANREQWQTRADFNYLPTDRWNLNLNLQWRDDDYDASELGLTEAEWYRGHLSASYVASETLSASVYAGYDYYKADQSSRAFRGGQEKNAFAVYPPLPQASDPNQNWTGEAKDTSITLGANVQWQVSTGSRGQLRLQLRRYPGRAEPGHQGRQQPGGQRPADCQYPPAPRAGSAVSGTCRTTCPCSWITSSTATRAMTGPGKVYSRIPSARY